MIFTTEEAARSFAAKAIRGELVEGATLTLAEPVQFDAAKIAERRGKVSANKITAPPTDKITASMITAPPIDKITAAKITSGEA